MSHATPPEPTIQDVLDRLDGIDQRLDQHDRRFDAIDQRLDGLASNMAKLADLCTKQFENLHARLDAQEKLGVGA